MIVVLVVVLVVAIAIGRQRRGQVPAYEVGPDGPAQQGLYVRQVCEEGVFGEPKCRVGPAEVARRDQGRRRVPAQEEGTTPRPRAGGKSPPRSKAATAAATAGTSKVLCAAQHCLFWNQGDRRPVPRQHDGASVEGQSAVADLEHPICAGGTGTL